MKLPPEDNHNQKRHLRDHAMEWYARHYANWLPIRRKDGQKHGTGTSEAALPNELSRLFTVLGLEPCKFLIICPSEEGTAPQGEGSKMSEGICKLRAGDSMEGE